MDLHGPSSWTLNRPFGPSWIPKTVNSTYFFENAFTISTHKKHKNFQYCFKIIGTNVFDFRKYRTNYLKAKTIRVQNGPSKGPDWTLQRSRLDPCEIALRNELRVKYILENEPSIDLHGPSVELHGPSMDLHGPSMDLQ